MKHAITASLSSPSPRIAFTCIVALLSEFLMPHHALAIAGYGDPAQIGSYDGLRIAAVVAEVSPITTSGKKKQRHKDSYHLFPSADHPLVLDGEASFYSREGCLGCNPKRIMANGQPLEDHALTIAIGADKSYLVGRKAHVTNITTGQSVSVRITDTGGFYSAKYGYRVADLTIGTKTAIGMTGGIGSVRVEIF